MFGRWCLDGFSRIWWANFLSNSEVRSVVLGPRVHFLEEILNLNKLRWLGHVLSIAKERLTCRTLLSERRNG